MRLISLSRGKFIAIVSEKDFKLVSQYAWYAHFSKRKGSQPYTRATINGKKIYLHRFIMNAPEGTHVDHKNYQTLDCRRRNLKVVKPKENYERRRMK